MRRLRNEFVALIADSITDAIDRLGDFIGRVTRDILAERGAEYLASRTFPAPRKSLDLLKNIVRNGHGSLHTGSITGNLMFQLRFRE